MKMKNHKMTKAEIHWWNALHQKKSALEAEFRSFWDDVATRIGLTEVIPGMAIDNVDGVSVISVPEPQGRPEATNSKKSKERPCSDS